VACGGTSGRACDGLEATCSGLACAIEEGGLEYSELEGLNFDIPHGIDRATVSKNKGKREGRGREMVGEAEVRQRQGIGNDQPSRV
jgi:hypothetical protein